MRHEMHHTAAAAAAQTMALIWGFSNGEFASATPIWVRVALIVVMGPAMMVGAAVRARAAVHATAVEAEYDRLEQEHK